MDHSVRLPPELLSLTLDYLTQPDVLLCAQVSRYWRSVATTHHMFYFEIWLSALGRNTSSIAWQFRVSQLSHRLRSCHRRNIRVSVALELDGGPGNTIGPEDPDCDGASESTKHPWQERFLSALGQHLGTVVRLVISGVHWPYETQMWDTLRQPAPHLLVLDVTDDFRPPPNLFAGNAPRLKHIIAQSFAWTHRPIGNIAAFSAVSSLAFSSVSSSISDIDMTVFPQLRSLFPALRTMRLDRVSISKGDVMKTASELHNWAPALYIDHLRLTDVLANNLPITLRQASVRRMSVTFHAEQVNAELIDIAPFFDNAPVGLSLLVEYSALKYNISMETSSSTRSSTKRWPSSVGYERSLEILTPHWHDDVQDAHIYRFTSQLKGLAPVLKSARIDHAAALSGVLTFGHLPNLERLSVDFGWSRGPLWYWDPALGSMASTPPTGCAAVCPRLSLLEICGGHYRAYDFEVNRDIRWMDASGISALAKVLGLCKDLPTGGLRATRVVCYSLHQISGNVGSLPFSNVECYSDCEEDFQPPLSPSYSYENYYAEEYL
ncbi:hypothetical protein EXIGLDRAFT_794662 [Exidia glandulosa HHB12029]|uniref:F-box domain-containing protein n=1 Tax=Exidia glandulosa HHB12029 TaxID=1314781 RepID=A0A165GD66_EXIGL|nr:hypothetical protein EXIGLDRAFT_794662 [Exidia glandulosa HHB12029]